MRGLIIVLLGTISIISWGQSDIEYQNKALLSVLQKENISDFSKIIELSVADSIKQSFRLHGKFFKVNSDVSQIKYIYTGRVNSCRAGGCSISIELPKEEESEYFDYFILFDKDKTVILVKVFNYQATHGQEVTSKGWLKQFIGHDGKESLQVGKNVDAISGATISVYAITLDVEMKTTLLKKILFD